ncbi:hypothetical protein NC651_021880 [Populus alba x Populus x berolinensis]|nr:hypothetical protein NC651_021880 [Populus alba x Populus x berolinensis]
MDWVGKHTKQYQMDLNFDDGLFPVALKGLLLPFHSRGHLVSAAFCFTPVRICRLHTITKKLNALMLRLRNLYSSASDDGLFPVALKGLLLPFHSREHLVSAAFCLAPVRIYSCSF